MPPGTRQRGNISTREGRREARYYFTAIEWVLQENSCDNLAALTCFADIESLLVESRGGAGIYTTKAFRIF